MVGNDLIRRKSFNLSIPDLYDQLVLSICSLPRTMLRPPGQMTGGGVELRHLKTLSSLTPLNVNVFVDIAFPKVMV